jgi:DNA-directed RNA polymerase subunit RPC12/RpoP
MRNPRQIDRLNESIEEPNRKAGVKCKCGSVNTVWIYGGGYQDADASRGMPIIETNGEIACNDCGFTWWD